MARQARTPVAFNKSTRRDNRVGMTSGRAGVVLPLDQIPLLRGDSCSGSFQASVDLAEMPKPLMNAVQANFQAWFVPKSAHPQFSGYDEFIASYQDTNITAAGQTARAAAPFFSFFTDSPSLSAYRNSTFLKTMGIHLMTPNSNLRHNADLRDAYNLIYNFRLAAHSSKLPLQPYVVEDPTVQYGLLPALWPSGKFANMVPDYERALVMGSLDLDVLSGRVPVSGIGIGNSAVVNTGGLQVEDTYDADGSFGRYFDTATDTFYMRQSQPAAGVTPQVAVFGEMAGTSLGITLADIDKARTTQAFAKLRTALAGNDFGFTNDDAIVAELMQGFSVPDDLFKRPWLLDSQRVTFGMQERHATDAANLDASVTKGHVSATLSLNVPKQDFGGVIIITCEILPEQLHERQGDWSLHVDQVSGYPDALRDVQRPEPVDLVPNWRVDERHTDPLGLYGYEPMNAQWDRDFTVLGGKFYQATPGNPFTEARSAVWIVDPVDPEFTADHYVAPSPFPHDVFSDTLGDAVEIAFRHSVMIRGLTQFGDVLAEDNDEYVLTQDTE